MVIKFLSKICICVDGLASSAAGKFRSRKPYIGHQNVPLVIRIPKAASEWEMIMVHKCIIQKSEVNLSGISISMFSIRWTSSKSKKANDYHLLKSAPCTYLLGFLGWNGFGCWNVVDSIRV